MGKGLASDVLWRRAVEALGYCADTPSHWRERTTEDVLSAMFALLRFCELRVYGESSPQRPGSGGLLMINENRDPNPSLERVQKGVKW